jgi:predicted DNA-binding transcriptional regulator AlpA
MSSADVDTPQASLVTQLLVAEKYGTRLNMDQLATELGLSRSSVYNAISAETFPIPTYIDSGRRFADFRDVALHLDRCRARARAGANSLA